MAATKKKIKLAELLLLRKELEAKRSQLQDIKRDDLFKLMVKRVPAHEGLDDLTMQVPLCAVSEVTAHYDFVCKKLRIVDALIQNTNWTTEITPSDKIVFEEYEPKDLKRGVDDNIA